MVQMIVISIVLGVITWFLGCMAVMQHKYHKVKIFLNRKTLCKMNKLLVLALFLILGVIAAFIFHTYGWLWTKAVRYLILMYGMLIIAYIDWISHIIPNKILLVLLGLRGLLLVAELILYSYATIQLLSSAFGGMVMGFLFFIIAYFISKKGIGMGDVKLVAVIGFYTGTAVLYAIMIFSLVLCILYSLVQMLRKKLTAKSFVAFGPFVAMGTIIAIFLGL